MQVDKNYYYFHLPQLNNCRRNFILLLFSIIRKTKFLKGPLKNCPSFFIIDLKKIFLIKPFSSSKFLHLVIKLLISVWLLSPSNILILLYIKIYPNLFFHLICLVCKKYNLPRGLYLKSIYLYLVLSDNFGS